MVKVLGEYLDREQFKEFILQILEDNKLEKYEFLRCFSSISCIHGYNKKEVMKQVKVW